MKMRTVTALQYFSIALIWIVVILICIWILNLLILSYSLHDVPSATFAISIIMLPVYITIASVLTFVFLGMQKEKENS